jgi:hypothetical protein
MPQILNPSGNTVPLKIMSRGVNAFFGCLEISSSHAMLLRFALLYFFPAARQDRL